MNPKLQPLEQQLLGMLPASTFRMADLVRTLPTSCDCGAVSSGVRSLLALGLIDRLHTGHHQITTRGRLRRDARQRPERGMEPPLSIHAETLR